MVTPGMLTEERLVPYQIPEESKPAVERPIPWWRQGGRPEAARAGKGHPLPN